MLCADDGREIRYMMDAVKIDPDKMEADPVQGVFLPTAGLCFLRPATSAIKVIQEMGGAAGFRRSVATARLSRRR